jgi:murein DD-endopeptidase MepM/ murein hydrolase activator NlpD
MLRALLSEQRRSSGFASVVPYVQGRDRPVHLDLSVSNKRLIQPNDVATVGLEEFVRREVERSGGTFGWGGYLEDRALYQSPLFSGVEPRTIHLGIDIWMPAGTPIFSPLDGLVQSAQDNNQLLDYGPTIVLEHNHNGIRFHTLLGHLSRTSLCGLTAGKTVARGEQIATLGQQSENGGWPTHLHLQLIIDMGDWRGDYPGVAELSKVGFYRANCPDPEVLLPWSV